MEEHKLYPILHSKNITASKNVPYSLRVVRKEELEIFLQR